MAHAELPEPHGPQCVFSALDNTQRFGRNRASIFQARGKTGGGRLVPHPQVCLPRQFPDFSFVQTRFEQRGQNMMLARGLLSGAKVALVVGVDSVGDGVESAGLAVALEDGEQFVLAVKTAHGIVAGVCGIFQFLRFHNLDRNFALARKGECVFEMCPRQAGGIGNHGAHLAAKHLMRHPGKKSGVHATRVSDDQANTAGEDLAQAFSFLIEHGRSVHDPQSTKKEFSVPSSQKHSAPRTENRELRTENLSML